MFVTFEGLTPTTPAFKCYSLQTYYQVIERMAYSDEMQPSEWEWKVEEDKLVPVMRQKLCSRCTDSDESLQLFGRIQYPKVYRVPAESTD